MKVTTMTCTVSQGDHGAKFFFPIRSPVGQKASIMEEDLFAELQLIVHQLFSRSSLGVLGCPGDCSSYPKGPLFDHSGSGGAANPLFESCPSRVSNSGLVGVGPTPSPLDWPLGREVTISIGVPR